MQGVAGVKKILSILEDEFDTALALTGNNGGLIIHLVNLSRTEST